MNVARGMNEAQDGIEYACIFMFMEDPIAIMGRTAVVVYGLPM